MSQNELAHLIKMANQIALNNAIGLDEEEVISKVENHISLFWARPMREKICAALEGQRDEFHPAAHKALERVQAKL